MVGAAKKAGSKSGMIKYKPGDVLFNQNDPADCLYIIQSGQIRLFIPKGRGFVDLAILRAGEVIGEMSYFDDKGSRRSCSASCIVSTEVVRISFKAFDKTVQGLNPWFKRIIFTLADRIRTTNAKVKELESNSVGYGAGGKVADYKFFHTADILKILSTLYLSMKSHGKVVEGKYQLHTNPFKYYLYDIYGVPEIKYEEFLNLLKEQYYIDMVNDENNLPKVIEVADLENLRKIMLFLNAERLKEEDKKIKVSENCERILGKALEQIRTKGLKPVAPKKVDEYETQKKENPVVVNLSEILDEFKAANVSIGAEDIQDARNSGLCDDIVIAEENKLDLPVYHNKLLGVFPALRLMNAIEALNKKKAGGSKFD